MGKLKQLTIYIWQDADLSDNIPKVWGCKVGDILEETDGAADAQPMILTVMGYSKTSKRLFTISEYGLDDWTLSQKRRCLAPSQSVAKYHANVLFEEQLDDMVDSE